MARARGPKIRFPPPAIYLAAFLLALFFNGRSRIPLVGEGNARTALGAVAIVFMLVGAFVMALGMLTFHRARTSILPFRPASALVLEGPYRFTRNPMYLGMAIVYSGASLAMNTGWPLILLPVALYAMGRFVIRVEEEYLESLFGEDYRTYRKRVRRWV